MKILVTGATGFIGNQLLIQFKEKFFDAVVLTRNPETAGVRLPIDCQVSPWDPVSSELSPDIMEGVDAVVHLAGAGVADKRWSEKRKNEIRESRILSTRQLVDVFAKLETKPKVFISASAIGVYGDRGDENLNENSSKGRDFLAQVCEEWEQEALKAESLGIRTVCLRVGIVLGNDGGALKRMLPPFRLGLGGPLGNGKQWMSWIHVRDLANLAIHCIETETIQGPVNAVAPHPETNSSFTKKLGQELGRPAFFPVPAFGLKLALGEMSSLLFSSQRVTSKKAVDSGFKFIYPKLETALRVICDKRPHDLIVEQWVPQPIGEVFAFFADARNLEKLTPPLLKLKILSMTSKEIEEGTQLNYCLKVHGVPVRWQSTILDWVPYERFADQQTRGPYAYWFHMHEFSEKNQGTVIRDHVRYIVPFWVPGDVVLHGFIKKDLEKIFSYRRKMIEEILGADSRNV
jgi:uncharacterized protein (TIGR01777 family)